MIRFIPIAALACGCSTLSPTSGAVQAGIATVETAICVLDVAAKDHSADGGAPSAAQVVADAIQQCGTDAATIARVLDAHRALEMAEAQR